ncbi:MAG TPA: hypothetical protein VFD36_15240 [Kofleriaceae bacterium]|nr:hypothetical protein [Kofleriaceae bacterium]
MARTVVSNGVTFQIDAEIGVAPDTNATVSTDMEPMGYITTGNDDEEILAFELRSPRLVFSGAVTPIAGPPNEIANWQLGIVQNVLTYNRVARYTNDWILTEAFQTGNPPWNPAPPPLRDGEPGGIPFYQEGAPLALNQQTAIAPQDSQDDPVWTIPVVMADGSTFEASNGDNWFATWLMLARMVDPPDERKIILLGRIRWRVSWQTTMQDGMPGWAGPVTNIVDVFTHRADVFTALNLPPLGNGTGIPDLRTSVEGNDYTFGTLNKGDIRAWSYSDDDVAIAFNQAADPNASVNWLTEPPAHALQARALRTVDLAGGRPSGAPAKRAARGARALDVNTNGAREEEGTVYDLEVAANVLWVDTGLIVDGDLPVSLRATSGSWTANPATGMVGPTGHAELIAKPGYNLPSAPEGLLVGQVGATVFAIGDGAVIPSGVTGRLYLSINDDMSGEYGAGFTDNEGAMQVEIAVGAVGEAASAIDKRAPSPIANAVPAVRVPPIGARLG